MSKTPCNTILKKTTNQEIQGKEYEILSDSKKIHTFFLEIEVEMLKKIEVFRERHGEFERGSNREDNE